MIDSNRNDIGKTRYVEYDIMKGLLIVMVVAGHVLPLDNPIREIVYWFHMPAFFLVSGCFLKTPESCPLLTKEYVLKLWKRYLQPMCAWILLFYIFSLLHSLMSDGRVDWERQAIDFGKATGPCWFIRALVAAHFVTSCTQWLDARYHLRFPYFTVAVAAACFLLTHSTQVSFGHRILQIFGAIFYVGIGKLWMRWHQHPLFYIPAFLFVLVFLNVYLLKGFSYGLDMSEGTYKSLVLDLCITMSFSTVIFWISKLCKRIKGCQHLSRIGLASLMIYFLHIPILILIKDHASPLVCILTPVAVATLLTAFLQSGLLRGQRFRRRISLVLLGHY